jgi:hypothetical protein
MRPYLCENILYKLFGHGSALILLHLSNLIYLFLYLITNIGDYGDYKHIHSKLETFEQRGAMASLSVWLILEL